MITGISQQARALDSSICLDIRANWIIILIYGIVTAVSLVPCIPTIWYAPPPGAMLSDPTLVTLTDTQK